MSEHVRRKGFSVRALREPDGEGSGEEGVIGEGGGGGGCRCWYVEQQVKEG